MGWMRDARPGLVTRGRRAETGSGGGLVGGEPDGVGDRPEGCAVRRGRGVRPGGGVRRTEETRRTAWRRSEAYGGDEAYGLAEGRGVRRRRGVRPGGGASRPEETRRTAWRRGEPSDSRHCRRRASATAARGRIMSSSHTHANVRSSCFATRTGRSRGHAFRGHQTSPNVRSSCFATRPRRSGRLGVVGWHGHRDRWMQGLRGVRYQPPTPPAGAISLPWPPAGRHVVLMAAMWEACRPYDRFRGGMSPGWPPKTTHPARKAACLPRDGQTSDMPPRRRTIRRHTSPDPDKPATCPTGPGRRSRMPRHRWAGGRSGAGVGGWYLTPINTMTDASAHGELLRVGLRASAPPR